MVAPNDTQHQRSWTLVCAIRACSLMKYLSHCCLGLGFGSLDIVLLHLGSNLQVPLSFNHPQAEIRRLHSHIQRPSDLLCFLTGLFVFLCCKKSLSIVVFLIIFIYVILYVTIVCICTMRVLGASRGQKAALDPPKLELLMIVNHHVYARN